VILYIVPPGRVAYWCDWHLWGLSKTEWGNIHVNVGWLFVVTSILHIYLNWKPIVSYMKKSAHIRIFTREFNIALMITLVVAFGTQFNIPPVSLSTDLGEHFKVQGAEKYGEPPYGHAELSSLGVLCKRMNIDLEQGLQFLKDEGIAFDDEKQKVLDVAEANNMIPQRVYEIMQGKMADGFVPQKRVLSMETRPTGMGQIVLESLCEDYSIDVSAVISHLASCGIKATASQRIKEIAEANDKHPMEVFEEICNSQSK
jgi:hypothetical protein